MNGHQVQQNLNPAPQPPPVPHTRDPREKSVVLACVLSGMPGLGQIYVGYYQRGFIHAVVIAVLLAVVNAGPIGGFAPMIGMFIAFFWLYNIIDAGRRADLYNQTLLGSEAIELPEDLKMPGVGGSIIGGLLLVAVSAILLTYTRFQVPMDWLQEWWPAAGVLLGLYLLVKGIMDRSAKEAD
jgi:TM2 domain-containing membrane protein YozV